MFNFSSSLPIKEIAEGEAIAWKHIIIRPTGLGVGMFAVSAAAWILALNYSVNLAYGLSFWILSFSIWAMLQAILQLYGTTLLRTETAECFNGENANLTITIKGNNLRRRRLYLRFINPLDMENLPAMQLLHTNDDKNSSVNLSFPTTRRGIVRVPVLQIYTHAPFSLLSVYTFLQTDWKVTVFPTPINHKFVLSNHEKGNDEDGKITKSGRDDVAFLSEYQISEPIKQIAWKQYAKSNKLLSKQMEEEHSVSSNIISYRDYPDVPSHDELASYMCFRVLSAEKDRRSYILELPYDYILPQNGQRNKALTALSIF
ncbi:MAG: DUF58 domain-containing protein [Neisseriaceae bacterium]|nr:DUF58 domain-containing protein [Neisseriaceae bacterium]